MIEALCAPAITGMTEESGATIVDAVAGLPARERGLVAGRLVEALVALPLLTSEQSAMFHAGPRA